MQKQATTFHQEDCGTPSAACRCSPQIQDADMAEADPEAAEPSSALACFNQRPQQQDKALFGPRYTPPYPQGLLPKWLSSYSPGLWSMPPSGAILAGHIQPLQKPISETIARAVTEVFQPGHVTDLQKLKKKKTG